MKKLKRVLALAMAVILSVPTLSTGTGTIPVKAADDSIELVVSNESAKYAGYETRKMSAGGNYAYCITPSKKTPDAGTYTKHYDVENYVKNVGDKAQAELPGTLHITVGEHRALMQVIFQPHGMTAVQWMMTSTLH